MAGGNKSFAKIKSERPARDSSGLKPLRMTIKHCGVILSARGLEGFSGLCEVLVGNTGQEVEIVSANPARPLGGGSHGLILPIFFPEESALSAHRPSGNPSCPPAQQEKARDCFFLPEWICPALYWNETVVIRHLFPGLAFSRLTSSPPFFLSMAMACPRDCGGIPP